jgi:mono/diheme cytochrome c family protein
MNARSARATLLAAGVLAAGVLAAVAPGATAHGADATGDAERGRSLFANRQCGRCHLPREQSGVGPAVEALRRPQGAFELAGRLWNHAPAMFTVLKHEQIEWPQISAAEMADLMAYLQADPARDPALDPARGWSILVKKGCLKCHRLRGEGGRLRPDLSERRPAYDSASAWAATMWTHTPRMAAKALEVGVLYPRFVGDEMRQLVSFLRGASR